MMNTKGFFFFKFDSRASLEAVLDGGPWLIRNSPIILKKWSMDTRLLKEELTRIPIWVKLHDVPIQVFEEDGISLITVHGKAIMLINIQVHVNGIHGVRETICVEYEWRPPKCDICKIFGHVHDHCPKKVVSPPIVTTSNVVTPTVEKTNDGFQMVGKKKKSKGRSSSFTAAADVLESLITSARNPVKEILLKLNLPCHKTILTDSKMEVKRRSVNVNEFKRRCIIKAFKDYQIKKGHENVGPEVTVTEIDRKFTRMAKTRFRCLVNDLTVFQFTFSPFKSR
ncbi:zinc knuckle CX2CX4HX4C containing protein [Tanacetum coccineum]